MNALALTSRPDEGLLQSARLMRALGPKGHAIWNELAPDEAARLSAAMDSLGPAGDGLEDEAAAAFVRAARRPVPVTAHTQSPNGSIWTALSNLPTDTADTLLGYEHPQTLALILSQMDSAPAARLLRALPSQTGIDVMNRVLHLGAAHPAALCALEADLTNRLTSLTDTGARSGHERVARIFDRLDSRSEKVFLAALENTQPGAGEKVRALMFTFDDLAGLDAAGLQTLLQSAERSMLIIALKGASPKTADAFFANMTQRAGALLKEEIAAHGAVRRSEVEEARNELITLARSLIHRGDIRVNSDAVDDELIE